MSTSALRRPDNPPAASSPVSKNPTKLGQCQFEAVALGRDQRPLPRHVTLIEGSALSDPNIPIERHDLLDELTEAASRHDIACIHGSQLPTLGNLPHFAKLRPSIEQIHRHWHQSRSASSPKARETRYGLRLISGGSGARAR